MTENKRSNWLKSLVAMRVLEAIVALISVDIISAIIHLFVADRLWNKSKFWRNFTAYLGVPLGLVLGLWWILEEHIIGGALIIVENIIIGILYIKSWNEFVPEKQNDLEEETPVQEGEELSGKTVDELDPEKNEIVSRLDELKKEYASGSMVDEEYEELRNSYQEKLSNINRRMKQ